MADPARPRVLLVDDDAAITSTLAPFLERSGFAVTTASDGRQGVSVFERNGADVAVLDVAMPELDGREVLRRLRSGGSWIPVVMLTQFGEAGERAMTLDEGADDYLNKPFDPVELVARIRSVLRRAHGGRPLSARQGEMTAGPLRVDRVSHRVFLEDREVVLSPKAVLLLDFLMSHPDEVLTRQRLLEVVWGYEHPVGTRAVDNRVAELRKVLVDDVATPRFVQTVPGRGYRFVAALDA